MLSNSTTSFTARSMLSKNEVLFNCVVLESPDFDLNCYVNEFVDKNV